VLAMSSSKSRLDDIQRRLRENRKVAVAHYRNGTNSVGVGGEGDVIMTTPNANMLSHRLRLRSVSPWAKSTNYFQEKYGGVASRSAGDDSEDDVSPEAILQRLRSVEGELMATTEAYVELEEKLMLAARDNEIQELKMLRTAKLNDQLELDSQQYQNQVNESRIIREKQERVVASLNAKNEALESENTELHQYIADLLAQQNQRSKFRGEAPTRISIALDKAVADLETVRQERDSLEQSLIQEQVASGLLKNKIEEMTKAMKSMKLAQDDVENKYRLQSETLTDINRRLVVRLSFYSIIC
jgi:chromosome segregation ATPase